MKRLTSPPVRLDAAWFADCRNRARATLESPPAKTHIVRIEPVGAMIASFCLPLELVQPQNRTHGKTWMLGKLKGECKLVMLAQYRERRTAPLPGRPMVRCIRFSSVEPDKYNDGFKVAVDRLVELKLLVDDKPACVDLHQTWEYAAPKSGFGLIEVFAGDPRQAEQGRLFRAEGT